MKYQVTQLANNSDVCGTLDDFIKSVREWVESTVPNQYIKTAYISLEKDVSMYSDHERPVLQVTWQRPETDEEERSREARENTHKAERRRQYEALKKEFGE